MAVSTAEQVRPQRNTRIAVALLVGAAVALGLGVYGRVHDPTGRSLVTLFFSQSISLKVWFATFAFGLALFQLVSALWIFGKLGKRPAPLWTRYAHRASGTLAFLLVVPVAYHCLWALGYQWETGTRVLVHGLAGCFFFGALATKVLLVRVKGMPNWGLPLVGGTLFTAVTVAWLTSSFWFFTSVEFPGF